MANAFDQFDAPPAAAPAANAFDQFSTAPAPSGVGQAARLGIGALASIPAILARLATGGAPAQGGQDLDAAARLTGQAQNGATLGFGPAIEGATDATGQNLVKLIQGKPTTWGADYNAARSADAAQNAQTAQQMPVASGVAQFAGGLVPAIAAGGVGSAASAIGNIVRGLGLGAAFGGASAVGNDVSAGNTDPAQVGGDALAGAGAGGALGGAGSAAAEALPALARLVFTGSKANAPAAQQRLAAFDRLGVAPTPAAVGGSRVGSAIQNVMGQVPLVGGAITGPDHAQVAGIASAADALANRLSPNPATQPADIGDLLRRIATNGTGRLNSQINDAYDQFTSQIGPRTPVNVDATLNRIRDLMPTTSPDMQGALGHEANMLTQMGAGRDRLPALQDSIGRVQNLLGQTTDPNDQAFLRAQLADLNQQVSDAGNVPWEQLKDYRTGVGRRTNMPSIAGGLRDQIYAALTGDQTKAAAAKGLDQEFTNLNSNFRNWNADREALAPTVDNPDPNAAFTRFGPGGLQNPNRLELLQRTASPDEWNAYRAATIARMGRATPSNQNAVGDAFSPETFLTNWNKMSSASKDVLFGGDPATQQTLNDLATVTAGRRLLRSTANTSGTGHAVMSLGAIEGALHAPQTAVPLGLGGALVSRAIMSPTVARWAAGLPSAQARGLAGLFAPMAGQAAGYASGGN